jgi:predicted nucleotidyltransferase
MSSFYRNEIGKMRPEDPDSPEQSKNVRLGYTAFETRLRNKIAKHLQQEIKFQVVGSVARGRAGADSDIDVVIRYRGSEELVLPQVRQAIVSLLEEMKQAGEQLLK